MQETTYQRLAELSKFREHVIETLPARSSTPSAEGTLLPPELDGSTQKERICSHLESFRGFGEEINQYAQKIIAELLTDFSDAPEDTDERWQQLEITDTDLQPTEKELEEIQSKLETS